jgi:nitroreductase
VVNDPGLKGRLRQASEKGEREMYAKVSEVFKNWLIEQGLSPDKPFLEEAPLLIIVLMKAKAKYARESIWTSIGYILLALEEHGYCTVPYTPSNTVYPLAELDVPCGYRLEAILPVGLSDDKTPSTDRVGLDTLVYLNRWGNKSTT